MARLLSQSDVEKLISMKDIVEILDKTYRGMGEGTVVNPAKGTLDLGESGPYPPYHADINSMPAYVGWVDTAGIKWAGGWMDNPARGLPYVSAIIVLVNPRNGIFTGVMDGTLITNLRTGAQTAVALKYLFPERKSLSVGLFGAGVQGRTQTQAIAELFGIDELRGLRHLPRSRRTICRRHGIRSQRKNHRLHSSRTGRRRGRRQYRHHAKDGFFRKEWFGPRLRTLPMGSYKECRDETLLSADAIVVDHVAQCLHRGALKDLAEAGRIGEKDITATLGELAVGKKPSSFPARLQDPLHSHRHRSQGCGRSGRGAPAGGGTGHRRNLRLRRLIQEQHRDRAAAKPPAANYCRSERDLCAQDDRGSSRGQFHRPLRPEGEDLSLLLPCHLEGIHRLIASPEGEQLVLLLPCHPEGCSTARRICWVWSSSE